MFRIRDDISSHPYTCHTSLQSCDIESDKHIERRAECRKIVRDIEIEPVRPSLDTRLIFEVSDDMVSEMSDHISDDISKGVDAETSGSGDTKGEMHIVLY